MTNDSKKPVTDDDLYRNSSQFRLWNFTKGEFDKRRRECHERAVKKATKTLQEKSITDIEPLTYEEELDLIIFYASKIGDIAKMFNMPSQVKSTAISYFRKFYIVYSVMDYHPKNILYTSVFLATKAENYFIPIENFCKSLLRTEPKDILDSEFLLLESLSFTLAVQNPLMSLHGFFLDIQKSDISNINESILGHLHDNARSIIVHGFITDVAFFYTPPQIALAALMIVNEELTLEYITKKFVTQPEQIEFLLSIIVECKQDLLNINLPSSDRGKAIDKKLHLCLNPDRKKKKRVSPSEATEEPQLKRLKQVDSSESTPIVIGAVDQTLEPLAEEIPEMTHGDD